MELLKSTTGGSIGSGTLKMMRMVYLALWKKGEYGVLLGFREEEDDAFFVEKEKRRWTLKGPFDLGTLKRTIMVYLVVWKRWRMVIL